MSDKQTVDALVEGGKASAAPPLGPALGPLGANVQKIIQTINEKTKHFAGMQVPVKVVVDKNTKEFEVTVGTPPVSALIKKELKLERGAKGEAEKKGKEVVGNLTFEQVVKIAEAKGLVETGNARTATKQVCGTCKSMGVTIEGKDPRDVIREIGEGKYDDKMK